jgi:hypothetical protein
MHFGEPIVGKGWLVSIPILSENGSILAVLDTAVGRCCTMNVLRDCTYSFEQMDWDKFRALLANGEPARLRSKTGHHGWPITEVFYYTSQHWREAWSDLPFWSKCYEWVSGAHPERASECWKLSLKD